MLEYILRRILWMIPTLFFVILITFVIMHLTPGGPWDTNPDSRFNDSRVQAALDRQYGLDKPLFFNFERARAAAPAGNPLAVTQAFLDGQFFNYLANLSRGELGPSYRYRGRDVQSILFEPGAGRAFWQNRVTLTVLLGLVAMALALVIGLPLGILAGLRQNTWIDHAGLFAATVGYGIPSLVMGILLIYIFAVWLDLVPVLDYDYWDSWQPWLLPAFALALPTAA
jgi:oligopeptide transport system permease protein